MAEADRVRWEGRYREGAHLESEPDPVLTKALAFAPKEGRALDVACGRGRHAIALARKGYDVDAVDIAPSGLASARERAGKLRVNWIEADLDTWEPTANAYAVVTCIDFTDEDLFPRLLRSLAPGGVLAYAAFRRGTGRHGPRPGDAARWFCSLETLHARDHSRRAEFVGRRGPSR